MKAAPSAIRRPRDKRDNQLFGLLFTLPFILGFVFIFLYIFITAIRFSVSDMSLGQNGFELSFVWLENFRYALRGDPNYMRILLDALKNMLTTIPVVLIFSLFVAVVLNRQLPGRTFFRAVFFLPVIVATGLISRMDMNNAVMSAMNSASIETGAETMGSAIGDITLLLQGMNFSPGLIQFVSDAASGVVNIVNLAFAVAKLNNRLHRIDDVFRFKRHRAGFCSAVKAGINLHAADAGQVICLCIEEQTTE